jgi:F0F1-type ATP synthase membrane subunit a
MNPGGVDPSTFLALALLVFVLVLFLGIATLPGWSRSNAS